MFPERGLDVRGELRGQLEPRGRRSVAAVRRGSFDPGRLQSSRGFELRVTLPVDVGPSAVRSPRRELAGETPVIQALDQTVYPAEAQCFVERILIIDRRDPGVQFVKDKPHLGLRVMVLGEPPPPLVPGLWSKRCHRRARAKKGRPCCCRVYPPFASA